MKELDFDELDRAVSSLMEKNQKLKSTQADSPMSAPSGESENPIKPEPTPVVTSQNTSPAMPVSVAPHVESTPAPTPSVPSRPAQVSVASRRGKFMDMVPRGSQSTTPAMPVSRQGASVQPSGPLMTDITPASKPEAPVQDSPVQPNPDTAQTASSEPLAKNDWPDPMDIASEPQNDAPVKEEAEPLSSPFLTGAKVEKRPLGSMPKLTEDTDAAQPQADTSNIEDDDTSAQVPPQPSETPKQDLPEELSQDVMALESDANTMALPTEDVTDKAIDQMSINNPTQSATVKTNEAEDTSPTNTPEKTFVSSDTPLEKPEEASAADTTLPSSAPVVPPGPISIPQQYRESPSTGETENAAIYDTDTYHTPLAHPKKKKSGWLWVVWIVLILVLGAAGGAALYFMGVF